MTRATPRVSIASPDFSLATLTKPQPAKVTPSKITDAHLARWEADSEDSDLGSDVGTPFAAQRSARAPMTLSKILEDDDTPAPELCPVSKKVLRATITQTHLRNWDVTDSESEVDSASEPGTPAKGAPRRRSTTPKQPLKPLENVLQ